MTSTAGRSRRPTAGARRPASTTAGRPGPADPRKSRAWRKLRDQVVEEEPECRLRLPGCTVVSTTADHIKHFKTHPDLALERSNLRGACEPCNWQRGKKSDDQLQIGHTKRPRALDIFRPLNELVSTPKNRGPGGGETGG